MQNALGKYAHAVSAGVVLCILLAWAAVHVGEAFGMVQLEVDTSQLDTFALAAFTYLLGNVSAINGVRPEVVAAHKRLDELGAPPAAEHETGHHTPTATTPGAPRP